MRVTTVLLLLLPGAGLLAAGPPHRPGWHRRPHTTTTRYLPAADVVGGTEVDTGRYEVAQYSSYADVRGVSDRWYQQEVFVRARHLAGLPVGQLLAVPNAGFTVQAYGRATWYFEQFRGIGGTLTRLPAPAGQLRLRLDLHREAQGKAQPLVRRTLVFKLDTGYFRRTRRDFHGEYDDLRLALKEPAKVVKLDLSTWAIQYEKRNGPGSGPDTLYRRLGELARLRELSLRYSGLGRLPPGLAQLKQLRKLDLSYNDLTSLPPGLTGLDSLRELNLAGNRLDSIPPLIGQLRGLRVLNLNDNRLRRYPEAVNNLTGLRALHLGNASLRRLPPGIGALQQLQVLGLNGFWNSRTRNELTDLEALAGLPQLRELYLQDNRLPAVPAAVYRLPNLEVLDLLYNGLGADAVDRARLPRLRERQPKP